MEQEKIKMLGNAHSKKLLNLGCGNRYHSDWVNIDFVSKDKGVRAYDLKKGIPYPDNTFDVVYHSHTLEHFTKNDAVKFIRECYRVLKPGGVIRIAIPDLEIIAKNYISSLELALSGNKISEANYDWMMLEMYDQTVRDHRGGEMRGYFEQEDILNEDFVKERMGHFFETMTKKGSEQVKNTWKTYVKRFVPINFIRNLLKSVKYSLPGEKYRQLGKFRISGEIHQWMYDRFSLGRLLKNIGFNEVIQRSARDSYIDKWEYYHLDSEPGGDTYKPDSLFMEAKK